jgi:hypothetical protein
LFIVTSQKKILVQKFFSFILQSLHFLYNKG